MQTLKLWIITICLVVGIILANYFSEIIMTFVISAAMAFLLTPAVDFLQKKMKMSRRGLPTLIVFLVALGLVVALVAMILPVLYSQIMVVIKNIGDYMGTLSDTLGNVVDYLREIGVPEGLLNTVEGLTGTLESYVVSLVADVGAAVLNASLKLLDLVIFFCLTFYFMLDGRSIYHAFESLFTGNGQIRIHRLAHNLNDLVWNYIRVHVVISLIMSIVTLIGFLCFGLEFALLLSIITFFMDFIPYIGSIIAGFIAALTAFLAGGWPLALWVLVFVVAVQQVEGNIIMPKFQARSMDVHPVAVIFSLLACGKLWGVFGMFISVPMVGLAKVIFIEIRDLYRSIDRPGGFGSPPTPEEEAEAAAAAAAAAIANPPKVRVSMKIAEKTKLFVSSATSAIKNKLFKGKNKK